MGMWQLCPVVGAPLAAAHEGDHREVHRHHGQGQRPDDEELSAQRQDDAHGDRHGIGGVEVRHEVVVDDRVRDHAALGDQAAPVQPQALDHPA